MPVVVSGLSNAVGVSAYGHSCALLADGTASCWGANNKGQLGNGTTTNSSTPVAVSTLTTATSITTSSERSCALLGNGTATCWGQQYGSAPTSTPLAVFGLSSAVVLAGGYRHDCAVLADGTGRCWRENQSGQLGNGTRTNSGPPVVVSGLTNAVAITGDGTPQGSHSCAVLVNGTARCWGYNGFGQLGNGTTSDALTPVVVSGI